MAKSTEVRKGPIDLCATEFTTIEGTLAKVRASQTSMKGAITRVAKTLKTQAGAIRDIEHKVYNGYDAKLDAVNDKVDRMDVINAKQHDELKSEVKGVRNMLFKMLITVVVGFAINVAIQQFNYMRELKSRDANPIVIQEVIDAPNNQSTQIHP